MKKIEDMIVTVVDHGQFESIALMIGKVAKQCFYCNLGARQTSFPEHWKGRLGEGNPEIDVIYDPFTHLDEIDLYVFTDIGEPEMQTMLAAPPPEGLGKLVWGNRRLEELENDRALMATSDSNSSIGLGNSTQYEPYYMNSEYNVATNSVENKRLGTNLVGADSSSNRTRSGSQVTTYNNSDMNQTY